MKQPIYYSLILFLFLGACSLNTPSTPPQKTPTSKTPSSQNYGYTLTSSNKGFSYKQVGAKKWRGTRSFIAIKGYKGSSVSSLSSVAFSKYFEQDYILGQPLFDPHFFVEGRTAQFILNNRSCLAYLGVHQARSNNGKQNPKILRALLCGKKGESLASVKRKGLTFLRGLSLKQKS